MEEVEFRRDGAPVEQGGERHAARARMHGSELPEGGRVGVHDARGRGLLRRRRRDPQGRHHRGDNGGERERSCSVGHREPPGSE
jgi:hypothetical protein